MSTELPPLPYQDYSQGATWAFTADQMHAYAMQERAAERERCAKVCERVDLSQITSRPDWCTAISDLCCALAAAIRATPQTAVSRGVDTSR